MRNKHQGKLVVKKVFNIVFESVWGMLFQGMYYENTSLHQDAQEKQWKSFCEKVSDKSREIMKMEGII